MRIDVLTLFPEFFASLTGMGVSARAYQKGLWHLKTWNPRDFVHDVHRTVDDRPYGGGPGMVMMAEPLELALSAAKQDRADRAPVILLSPTGKRFDQEMAARLATSQGAVFVCGRYEGIDQRFIDRCVDEQWSLGDFVLSGGEPALLPMLDAAIRLIPGVLNQGDSHGQDSFQPALGGLLDCPHYTRPEVHDGQKVPAVLLSGHHDNIALWRRQQSLRLTLQNRPDLIAKARQQGLLSKSDELFLQKLEEEKR